MVLSGRHEQSLQLRWNHHAIERAAERIGMADYLLIDAERVLSFARSVTVGKRFSVKRNGVRFGCVRTLFGVLVLTVVVPNKLIPLEGK